MPNERILIVEDDEDLVYMLEYNLQSRGYATVSALDGLSAYRLIEQERPDLILLDIMLPGVDGWQICAMVRSHQHPDICETPIVMLTALGSTQAKLKGIEMGADDYIPKPFSIKEVMLKVDRLIAREARKRSLGDAVKKLEAREMQRSDFQDMLFHELKNQLTIMGGYLERMAGHPVMTPERYQRHMEVIRECSHSLHSITEEMLLLSRIESGEFALTGQEISFHETVHEVMTAISGQADRKGIKIGVEHMGKAPPLKMNAFALRLAVSNLVENAIKYSPQGSDITVRVGSLNGTGAMVEVTDRGPGIPISERDKIFDKFYRGENVRARTKGTGLGLYITKRLIESMGGTIRLMDEKERGASFRVTFRLPEASPSSENGPTKA
jgi:two-component system, sensor histidine kinase and response regulator